MDLAKLNTNNGWLSFNLLDEHRYLAILAIVNCLLYNFENFPA